MSASPYGDTARVTFGATAVISSLILRYDGAAWHTYLADTLLEHLSDVTALWGTDDSSVWAVATGRTNVFRTGPRYLLRLSPHGLTMSPWAAPQGRAGISGTSGSNVFAATYRPPHSPSTYGAVHRFDGQSWTPVYETTSSMVWGVWSVPGTIDAIAIGREMTASEPHRGDLMYYDGETGAATWAKSPVWSATPATTLFGIWGPETNNAFIVGSGGTVLRYDGNSWAQQETGATATLYGVHGSSSSSVFAVGENGTILHFNGSTWTQQASGATAHLRAVWANSPSDVFAVGDSSTVLHYDGVSWRAHSIAEPMTFHAVWGAGPSFVLASGAWRR